MYFYIILYLPINLSEIFNLTKLIYKLKTYK